MEQGHPFKTEQLDKQRVEQRRMLRGVPDWLLREAGTKALPDQPTEASLLEEAIRDHADQLASDKKVTGLLLDSLQATQTSALSNHLRDRVADGGHLAMKSAEGIADDLYTLGRDGARAVQAAVDNREVSGAAIISWVQLAIWADDLADDGYRDPRLS